MGFSLISKSRACFPVARRMLEAAGNGAVGHRAHLVQFPSGLTHSLLHLPSPMLFFLIALPHIWISVRGPGGAAMNQLQLRGWTWTSPPPQLCLPFRVVVEEDTARECYLHRIELLENLGNQHRTGKQALIFETREKPIPLIVIVQSPFLP